MKYLVLECHPAYAVVLDESGAFLKVANLNYEVGQTVTSVITYQEPKFTPAITKFIVPLATTAACLCLMFVGAWQYILTPYGIITMKINPSVQITVNRLDYVIDLEGLNEDGIKLIEGYDYHRKDVEQVSDDLADLAVAYGYLSNGGIIHLNVDSQHENWKIATEEKLLIELELHMGDTITITLDAPQDNTAETEPSEPVHTPAIEVIPIPSDDDDGDDDDDNDSDDDGDDSDDDDHHDSDDDHDDDDGDTDSDDDDDD